MTRTGWKLFDGTHFEVGQQLGKYWCDQLHGFRRNGEGRRVHKLLTKPRVPSWQRDFERLFCREFPELACELHGMVEGARKACFEKASFSGMLRIALGEAVDPKGCSSIAIKGRHANFLAHNEEESPLIPLCYAKVRLRDGRTKSEFLSVSYPFQFFGSAVGANANVAFTGNSIGLTNRTWLPVKESRSRRMPKTVLTRLMLECSSISEVQQLLVRFDALQPSHWFVADKTSIVSIQMRPSNRIGSKQRNGQICVSAAAPTSCHTNHFQSGETAGWFLRKSIKESAKRLGDLSDVARDLSPIKQQTETGSIQLEDSLKSFRNQKVGRMRGTLATIVLAVGNDRTDARAFDYFYQRSVGIQSTTRE